MVKTIDKTYLYSIYPSYEKSLYQYVMTAERIDVLSEEFANILNDVKQRAVSNNMVKAIQSSKVKLTIGGSPLGKAVKVFTMKDVKNAPTSRVTFIDCTTIIHKDDSGSYKCADVDKLISYLLSAMTQVIYYDEANSRRLTDNSTLTKLGSEAFGKLMFNIVDYIAKISSVPEAKEKCIALSSYYYQICILGKGEINNSVSAIVKQVAKVSDRMIATLTMDHDEADFINLKAFCDTISSDLHTPKITPEAIVAKWMYVYDPSTTFGLELFPNFCSMITDAYIGSYLNNQKTIQKVLDSYMVEFAKQLISIEGVM